MGRLEGRIALVTGASRGIGEAIALACAREGARVVVASRKQAGVDAAAERIREAVPGADVTPRVCHVGRVEELEGFVQELTEAVGLPDVLVNNAATNPYYGPALDLTWGAWDKTFEVNLKGPFELTRQVARRLVEAGQGGAILNVSSVFGLVGAPGQVIYAMTKAALVSMTRTLAHELGPQGIRVNCLAPGLVETRFAAALLEDPEARRPYEERAALGRAGLPHEVAAMALALVADDGSYMTGSVVRVDGGYTAG